MELKGKKVLVTGATGFIGGHLVGEPGERYSVHGPPPGSIAGGLGPSLLGGAALEHDRIVSNLDRSGRFGTPIGPTQRIWHRTVVRYSTGGFTTFGTRHDDASQVGSKGIILVVSPSRVSGGPPGQSAVAASAAAE